MRIFFLITLVFISCGVSKKLKTISYPTHYDGHKLIVRIPRGYSFLHVGWESTDDIYRYKDSSIIYFTDQMGGGINYENIKEAGKSDSLFYMQMEKENTFILSGIDKKGLHWKNWSYGKYSIGYNNVSKQRKDEFDKVLQNIEIR